MGRNRNEKRGRYYVDKEVQKSLARRIALQWLMFVLVCYCLVGFLQACIEHPSLSLGEMFTTSLKRNILPIVAGFSLIPVFVHDMIRSTNRFAGPVTRLRQTLREIATDGEPRELKIREGDFWYEMADEFNTAIAKMQEASNKQKAPETDAEPVSV